MSTPETLGTALETAEREMLDRAADARYFLHGLKATSWEVMARHVRQIRQQAEKEDARDDTSIMPSRL